MCFLVVSPPGIEGEASVVRFFPNSWLDNTLYDLSQLLFGPTNCFTHGA
jgi:hypothetical protein